MIRADDISVCELFSSVLQSFKFEMQENCKPEYDKKSAHFSPTHAYRAY
jgi:hypothetical protein